MSSPHFGEFADMNPDPSGLSAVPIGPFSEGDTSMRIRITLRALAAIVLPLSILLCGGLNAMAKAASPAPAGASQAAPARKTSADDPRNSQIRAIVEKIRALREQFQSQTAPLEAQIKSLREKFDAELASLEAQRKALVEQGESSGLKSLMD